MYNIIKKDTVDILIPISIENDSPSFEEIVSDILWQKENYGFTRFMLSGPSGGWRSKGYPPKEHFTRLAELFLKVKNALIPYGIQCGWWITATLKSGTSSGFTPQIKSNGEEHPFSNCPLDPNFRKCFCENVSHFAKIAKPFFIVTEDDYSISAANGCFCKYHLEEFAKRTGKYYSRQELTELIAKKEYTDKKEIELLKKWRGLLSDSLSELGEMLRAELDKESPEIPVGYMQAGGADYDGNCTLAISRAFAGKNHTPFSRLYGAMYEGVDSKLIPHVLYHALYTKQHINEDFLFYHESDTFPHTRFFTSGAQMRAIMATVYSYGFDGSTFQTCQLLDFANEETAYGFMFKKERARFNKVKSIVGKCRQRGVQIAYDAFVNTIDKTKSTNLPLWEKSISRFGIPYTTLESDIAFWDDRQTKYLDHSEIMSALSKNLFLDAEAAKALCKRGYGKYIGVEIGEDVTLGNKLGYDLGAREIICEKFRHEGKGKNMPSAHMYSPKGNGRLLGMTLTDEKCEVISELYTFDGELVSPAMTRFSNSLGGKVIVFGETLDGNNSHSLFNYRRQRLIFDMLDWCGCSYVTVRDIPNVFVVENRAKEENCGFSAMLTIINLCEDTVSEFRLNLPKNLSEKDCFEYIGEDGETKSFDFERCDDGITVKKALEYLNPLYIIIR